VDFWHFFLAKLFTKNLLSSEAASIRSPLSILLFYILQKLVGVYINRPFNWEQLLFIVCYFAIPKSMSKISNLDFLGMGEKILRIKIFAKFRSLSSILGRPRLLTLLLLFFLFLLMLSSEYKWDTAFKI